MRRLLLLSVVLAPLSCGRRAGLPVAGIDAVDRTAADEPVYRPTADEVGRMVRDVLDEPAIRWDDSAPDARRLRVEFSLVRSEVGGRGVLRAEIRLRLEAFGDPDAPPIEASGVVDKSFVASAPPDARAVREHLARGLRDVGGELLAQVRVWAGDSRALIGVLRGPDGPLREVAIRAAAARREKEAVPALLEILRGPDEPLSESAIGALVAIGDRRAVRPLCEHASLGDPRGMARVIDAIASLGGGEARAYLELVGAGHDDPTIREMARDALARMDRLRR